MCILIGSCDRPHGLSCIKIRSVRVINRLSMPASTSLNKIVSLLSGVLVSIRIVILSYYDVVDFLWLVADHRRQCLWRTGSQGAPRPSDSLVALAGTDSIDPRCPCHQHCQQIGHLYRPGQLHVG